MNINFAIHLTLYYMCTNELVVCVKFRCINVHLCGIMCFSKDHFIVGVKTNAVIRGERNGKKEYIFDFIY